MYVANFDLSLSFVNQVDIEAIGGVHEMNIAAPPKAKHVRALLRQNGNSHWVSN